MKAGAADLLTCRIRTGIVFSSSPGREEGCRQDYLIPPEAKGLKPMNYQHVENLLIRYRGGTAKIKTMSGENYEGTIADVTNDYVALKVKDDAGEEALKMCLCTRLNRSFRNVADGMYH
jgi:hypothetical protein